MLEVFYKVEGGEWIERCIDNIQLLIETLYKIGFIKIYAESEQGYVAYYDTHFYQFSNVTQIKIHDAFVCALKCKRDKGKMTLLKAGGMNDT